MKYFTGIDVSLRSVSICVVDEVGVVQYENKVASRCRGHRSGAAPATALEIRQVGLESGTLAQYLTYGLQKAGYEVICLEARQTAATLAAMRNKTNRNDARGLAQILRTGWYRTVHLKSLQSHQVRALLASRKAILAKCVDLENELRGFAQDLRRALRLPRRSCPLRRDGARGSVDDARARHEPAATARRTVLYKSYLKLDNAVKGVVRHDPVCQRLMTVPGVGPVHLAHLQGGRG